MTTIGDKPPQKKSVGGVTYDANHFNATRLPDGRYQLQAKKSKEIIIFPAQSSTVQTGDTTKPRQAEVKFNIERGLYWDDTKYNLSEIDGCEFQASKRGRTNVDLNNCTNSTVDLSANDSLFFGDHVKTNNHGNNTIILDRSDSAEVHCDKMQLVPIDDFHNRCGYRGNPDASYDAFYNEYSDLDRRQIKTRE